MRHMRKRRMPTGDLSVKPPVTNKDCSYSTKANKVLNNIRNSTLVRNIASVNATLAKVYSMGVSCFQRTMIPLSIPPNLLLYHT